MRGDLRSIPQALALSKATIHNIKQNLIWAFGYKIALIPIVAGVLAPFTCTPHVSAAVASDSCSGCEE